MKVLIGGFSFYGLCVRFLLLQVFIFDVPYNVMLTKVKSL